MYLAKLPWLAVARLSEVPQEVSSVFSLFCLIKLHLASYPLASSYSRVTVSLVFCFSAQVCGYHVQDWQPYPVDLILLLYV